MLKPGYDLIYAQINDVDSWMRMVDAVKDNFPGLEANSYKETLIKNIKRKTALCVKCNDEIVGVMLFSYHSQCLSCMAVHPSYRRKGIASSMIETMISLFPNNVDIQVTTFRSGDSKGIAPRALYKKYGFIEDELLTEFGYPCQKFVLHRK